jgi:Chaperone of endosialidase
VLSIPPRHRLTGLQPVSYEWRRDEHREYGFGSGRTMGLIAQDVEKVFAAMIAKDERG